MSYQNEPPDPPMDETYPPDSELVSALRNLLAEVECFCSDNPRSICPVHAAQKALDFEDAENLAGAPRLIKRSPARVVWCCGCEAEARLTLGHADGDEHEGCPQTAGVVGYWIEIPQPSVYLIAYPNGMSIPVPPQPEEENPLDDLLEELERQA